jgi:TRAP-type C4-dicarboxylate transport system permease small subunit
MTTPRTLLPGVQRLADGLHLICAYVFLPLMTLVVCLDVIGRYIFNSPIGWASDLITITLLAAFMSGIPICTAQDGNIRVETFYEDYSEKKRALADMLGSTAGLAFMGLLAFRGFADIPKFIKQNSQQEMLGFPHWIVAAFIGVCAVSTSLVLINQIWLAMLRLRDAWGNAEAHPHNT